MLTTLRLIPLLLVLLGCGAPQAQSPPEARHIFKWSWRLIDGSAVNPNTARLVSCKETGTRLIGMAFENAAGEVVPYESPCTPTGSAESDPLPDGRYRIAVAALDQAKAPLNTLVFSETLKGDADLGEFTIPLWVK